MSHQPQSENGKPAGPIQPELDFTWTKPVFVPQGDGSFLLKPGKPQAWLTPSEFAAEVGLSARSIYDYIGSEALPSEMVEYTGARKIRIQATALEHWRNHFRTLRDGGIR